MAQQVSGQVTVSTAGTAVAGPDIEGGVFQFQANPANTGTYCYVGSDGAGDVSSTTGFTLKKGQNTLILVVSNLDRLYFDSDTNGDKVDWIRLDKSSGDAVV